MSKSPPLSQAVHFFNARGFSVLTEDHYVDVIVELRRKLNEADSRIAGLVMRLQALGDDVEMEIVDDD